MRLDLVFDDQNLQEKIKKLTFEVYDPKKKIFMCPAGSPISPGLVTLNPPSLLGDSMTRGQYDKGTV